MKTLKYIFSILMTMTFMLLGCTNYVSKDDISPNSATKSTSPLLLPTIEVCLFATYTGQTARTTGSFVQHFEGVQFQSQEFGRYNIQENDVTNEWQTIYNAGIANCNILINEAGSKKGYYYVGMAKVLRAMLIGITTDLWGDIPYREAGLGAANLTPTYENQEQVLQEIQQDLDEGIVEFKKTKAENLILPTTDDFIYGGDPAKWIKMAYILKARYANRLSKKDPGGSADKVLEYINLAGLTGNSDDANALFTSAGGTALNQWYDFENSRAGYIRLSATLVDTLIAMNDPRLPVYATVDDDSTDGDYSGAPLGATTNNFSYLGSFYASEDSPLPLVTYTEAMFLKAEAALRKADDVTALDAYMEAIVSSFDKLGVDDSVYLATNGVLIGSSSEKLAKVMYEKWVASITQPEAYSDWRRTGFPVLTPNPEGFIDVIPRRYPTEQNERLYNSGAVGHIVSDLISPVWWDQP